MTKASDLELVADCLESFRKVANIKQNERQPDSLVEATYLSKLPKNRPGGLYIDSYVTFYNKESNIRINGIIKNEGDAPIFLLRWKERIIGVYNNDKTGLSSALVAFKKLVAIAVKRRVTSKEAHDIVSKS